MCCNECQCIKISVLKKPDKILLYFMTYNCQSVMARLATSGWGGGGLMSASCVHFWFVPVLVECHY